MKAMQDFNKAILKKEKEVFDTIIEKMAKVTKEKIPTELNNLLEVKREKDSVIVRPKSKEAEYKLEEIEFGTIERKPKNLFRKFKNNIRKLK